MMIDSDAGSARNIARAALHAESEGFDLVTVHPDHPSAAGRYGSGPTLEAWTAITWIAASTERIRVCPAVLAMPYRHPLVVAKMAETLDRLSGHRLVLAIGAGGDDRATAALGLPGQSPAGKVRMLTEAVEIIRGLGSEAPLDYSGEHFHLRRALINPPGDPAVPLWLGVHGRRMIRLVAERADGWLPSYFGLPPESLGKAITELRRRAREAGRDPALITCGYNIPVRLGAKEETTPDHVGGPPAELAGRIAEFVRAGVTHVNFWPVGDDFPRQTVSRLATDVIPRIRAECE